VVVSSGLTDDVAKIIEFASLEGLRLDYLKSLDHTAQALVSAYQSYIDFDCPSGNAATHSRSSREVSWAKEIVQLCVDEATDYLEQMKLFCYSFGMSLTEKDLQGTFNSLLICAFFAESHSVFKYHANVIFTGLIEDDSSPLPEILICETIFPRKLRVFLKREQAKYRNGVHRTRILGHVYSLFQGLKKALLPIRPHHVDRSLLKHSRALTTAPKPLTDKFRYFCQTQLREDFKNLIVPEDLPNSPKSGRLSCKSTVESSLRNGGQVGLALRCLREPTKRSALVIANPDFNNHIIPMNYFMGMTKITGRQLLKRGSSIIEQEDLDRFVVSVYSEFSDDEIIEELLFLKDLGLLSSNVVQPCVVLEPLKGRIITKPSTGDYIVYNRAQSYLWQKLSKYRQFELIGRPVTVEDIYFISKDYERGDVFVSGDYDGATDNLSSELSEIVIRFLFSRYSQDYRDALMGTFCRSLIDYTRSPLQKGDSPWPVQSYESVKIGKVQQVNGQLMGHVLSFIVLCLANYLIYQYSYWKDQLVAPNVLINGDDILFKTTPDRVDPWKDSVQSVGFFPSVGKNLVNDKVCQINSELFEFKYADIPLDDSLERLVKSNYNDLSKITLDRFPYIGEAKRYIRNIVQIEYVNFGIIRGRGKGKTESLERVSISQCEEDNFSIIKTLPAFWEDQRRNLSFSENFPPTDKRYIKYEFILSRPCLRRYSPELLLTVPELILRSCLESPSKEFEAVASNSLGNLLRSSFVPDFLMLNCIRKFAPIYHLLPPGLITIQESVFGTLLSRMETKILNRQ